MGALTASGDVGRVWEQWRARRRSETRSQLVCHYLPLVKLVARSTARRVDSSDHPDLISFGVIGLMDAIDKFDVDVGVQFETYASRRIRGAMVDGLRSLRWLPRGAERRAGRVIEKVVTIDFQTARTPIGKPLAETLCDPVDTLPDDGAELDAEHEEVDRALNKLPDRERYVLLEYYFEERPLAKIGDELGITESRVCQLHRRGLALLKSELVERLSA